MSFAWYYTYMNWDTRRKLVYALAFVTGVIALLVFLLRGVLFPEPTCNDRKMNGFELGVDCGGACSLKCTQEVNPLTVLWAKALYAGSGMYDFAGMVKNTNIDNASRELGYVFTAYAKTGEVMTELSGSTTAPLDGSFPIIIQNIPLKSEPGKVALRLIDGDHYKVVESPTSPTLKILERRYESGQIPRVYATVMNTKRVEITNLPIRVVLFDQDDNAYAVGETILPALSKEGVREVVFTWNAPFPIAPTRIGVYPIFNPFDAVEY